MNNGLKLTSVNLFFCKNPIIIKWFYITKCIAVWVTCFFHNTGMAQNYIFKIDSLDIAIIGDSTVLQINGKKKVEILTVHYNPSVLYQNDIKYICGDTNIKWDALKRLEPVELKSKKIYIDSFVKNLVYDTFFRKKIEFYSYYSKVEFYNKQQLEHDTFQVNIESTLNRAEFEKFLMEVKDYFLLENKINHDKYLFMLYPIFVSIDQSVGYDTLIYKFCEKSK